LIDRIFGIVRPILMQPPLPARRLALVALVTAAGVTLSIVPYAVLGRSLGFPVSVAGWLLVIPLVWVIKMAPVTVGGIGVGEGAIAGLMVQIFGAQQGPALAIAFAYLALQFTIALLGGVITANRMMTGSWITVKQELIKAEEASIPQLAELEPYTKEPR
jgi:hypothetical protein